MALKFYLMSSMLVVCGFLIVIQPAWSLTCRHKVCEEIDGNTKCIKDEMEECESTEDRCVTINYKTNHPSIGLTKRCETSGEECDEEHGCRKLDHVYNSLFGESVTDCSLTCCEGDGCNDTDKKKSTLTKLRGKKKDSTAVKSREERLAKLISNGF